ncbi:GntP family permease [Aegicerativicinus sediminis]|uniref:GntP family permease n=1 Tax=Aegicerativicinus sediminis TaxID=2893202 RepID=UPI001E2A50E5|nr:gluconate:H+ symporter [Aegicerativicinus sediminis]
MELGLILAVLGGIAVLLLLILRFKLQAFLALLIGSIVVGILAGISPNEIMTSIQNGMGNTLGFVAVVVGLGAIFGAILEQSGGANAIANYLLKLVGDKKAGWALMATGFIISIPVFFDVAFIILIPLLYSIQRRTRKSLLLYAIPLLAGLAVTHSFIPPTPGPIAVADILNADLGWVIILGILVGLPTAIISGPLFGKYISSKIFVEAPKLIETDDSEHVSPPIGLIFIIISIPIVLIVCNTVVSNLNNIDTSAIWFKLIQLMGHPFGALIIANLLAWYLLGTKRGFSSKQLLTISTKSLNAVGAIILLTGAGGVFKEILITTHIGEMIGNLISEQGFGLLIMAFLVASLVRILQGSATVAMITAAGLVAPALSPESSETTKAFLVLAIASGATILSHVNDSGFWLVSNYLGLSEKQTFRSWTVMTCLLSLTGFALILLLQLFF